MITFAAKNMQQKKSVGHIAIFMSSVIFGLNTPISRTLIPETLNPYALTFLRMLGAMFLFWLVSIFSKKEHVPPKDILMLFFASVIGIVLNQMSFIVGLSHTSPIDASIILTLSPITSMFLAAMILKEPITLKKAFGVLLGASGALLLILSRQNTQMGQGNLTGNLIVLLSMLSFALYLTVFKKLISKYSPVTCMKWMFLFASIITFPFSYKALSEVNFSSFTIDVYLRIGYVIIFATFIAYFLIPIGQKLLRPTVVSTYNYLQPIIASLVAVMLGMDTFGIEKIASGILVFIGVYFVTISKSRAQMEKEKKNKINQIY